MKNKLLRRTIAIIMTLGMLLGSVSGHVTPVFATGEDGDAVVTEVSREETQAPTEPEAPPVVVETEAQTEETTTVAAPAEEPTAPPIMEEPTPEETTEAAEEPTAPETEEPTTAAPTEPTTAAPTETTTAPEETKEKTVKELVWDGGTVKITVSRKDGAEIPESSTLKVETLNSMNQSKSEEEELSIIKSFYEPAIDKIADEYGLDKASEAYKALVAGLLPFAVSIKDKDGKETVPEMNVKIEVKDSSNELYDLVNVKQTREIRVAEFDAYKNATLLRGDKASVSFDTAKGTYTAAAKTSSAAKYVVILYIDNDKVKEAQPKAAEQKDDSEEETDGEDADPDSEQPAEEETAAPEEETPAEEETPEETPAEEEVVEKSDRLLGGRMFLAEGGSLRATGDDSEIGQYAASRYGEDATDPYSQITAQITSQPTGPFLAGDTVQYSVTCLFRGPLTKQVSGYDKPLSLFDVYEESYVTISLPEGLLLTGAGDDLDIVSVPNDNDPDTAHQYIITLEPRTAKSEPIDFTFSIYICNNGTNKSVKTYDFNDFIKFETSFWVLDKNYQADDPNAPKYDNNKPGNYYVHLYEQEVIANADSFSTVTPDQWGLEKSLVSASLSDDETTATFKWKVDVGLLRENAEGTLVVVKDKADPIYKQNGRDALEYINVSDNFLTKLFKKAEGQPEVGTDVPDSLLTSLTIQKSGGTAEDYTKNSSVPLSGSLALDTTTVNINKTPDFITDEDGTWTSNNETADVPVWTTYYVTATYEVTDDMIADFKENIKYRLESDNTAKLDKYKLAEIDERTGNTGEAVGKVFLPVKDPATLTIKKYLNSDSNEYADQFGTISYTLSSTTPFTVYSYDETTKTYSSISGDDPVLSFAASSNTKYYLEPDITYTVTENLTDPQKDKMALESEIDTTKKPVEGEDWTAKIINSQHGGKVIINKIDDVNQPVKGAEFTLFYKNDDGTETKVTISGLENPTTTVASGYAEFAGLPYGNYVLKETGVAAGYAMGSTTSWDITLSESNKEYSFGSASTDDAPAIVNTSNIGTIQLTKYVGIAETKANMGKAAVGYGTFTLQRRLKNVTGSEWEAVTKDIEGADIPTSIEKSGGYIDADVPIADANGRPYEYRFVETIPSGYYDPETGSTTTAESDAVSLSKKPAVSNVDMYNRKFVSLQINKDFLNINADGSVTTPVEKTTTVTLYSYTGAQPTSLGDANIVKEGTLTSQTVGKDSSGAKSANWTNLKVYDGENQIHYVVKEADVAGYALNNATVIIGGVKYVEIPMSGGTADAYTTKLTNYQQAIPVKIWKENYYTEAHNVTGSEVTIYTNTDFAATHIAKDARDASTELSGVSIPGTDPTLYAVVYLTPGQKYYFKETKMPDSLPHLYGYTADGQTAIKSEYGIIDLTSTTVVNGNVTVKEYYVYNYEDPLIHINKKDSVTGSAVSGTNLQFEVYKKVGATYQRYEQPTGTPVTISTVNADSTTMLPEGEYYFHEVNTPDGYLNPDVEAFYNLYYAADNSRYVRATVDGQTITLAKVNVTNKAKDGKKVNLCTFDFINIPNKGKMRVTKYIDNSEATQTQIGFVIRVTGNDTPATTKAGETGKTSTDSSVVTTYNTVTYELPVYNADGTKIQYTITEDALSEDLAKDYYKDFDGQTVELDIFKTNADIKTKDASGDVLKVVNKTRINLNVDKVRRYTWQYSTGTTLDFPLSGATIALYRKKAGTDTWEKVKEQATGEEGRTTFEGVERGYEYMAVEVSCTNKKLFPITSGGAKLQYLDPAPDTITDAQIAAASPAYNILTLTTTQVDAAQGKLDFGTLYNADHWAQFHVTKYLDTLNRNADQLEPVDPNNPTAPHDELLNHCVFSVYRCILTDGATSVEFDSDNPLSNDWIRIGTYTSGTFYDADGNRKDGELQSIVDSEIDENYVYLLVEDNTGANGGSVEIMPEYKYTFWYCSDHNPVTCTVDDANVGRTFTYNLDEVTHTDVLNNTPSGPGNADTLIASFRLAKWRIEYNDDGTLKEGYFPLSNALFQLRLPAHGDVPEQVISELVSGKDGGDLVAVDQSGTFTLEIGTDSDGNPTYALRDYEAVDKDPGKDYKSFDVNGIIEVKTTAEGWTIYCIKVNLYEISAPRGYGFPSVPYETYLCFVNKNEPDAQHYWYANDLYYVTESADNANIKPARDQDTRYWYITNMDQETSGAANVEHLGDLPQRRIIDYPMNNTMVTIHKFGYKPTLETKGENSLALYLDDSVNKTPMGGVTMILERKDPADGAWHPWNPEIDGWNKNSSGAYVEYTFATDDYGRYECPKGLPAGTYRVYEKSLVVQDVIDWGETYENAYPIDSKDKTDDYGRMFTIPEGLAGLDVFMANPEKYDLTLKKQDMSGHGLNGAQFTLTPSTGTAITNKTGADGSVKFSSIPSGTYKLTENVAGYTSSYLTKYFASEYSSLVNLVNGTGQFIGYTFGTATTAGEGTDNRDTVVQTISPTQTTGSGETAAENMVIELTIKNPKNTSIQIIKHGESDKTFLSNASFVLYYHPFDDITGNTEIEPLQLTAPTNYGNSSSGKYWTSFSGNSVSTNTNGIATVEDLWPGIYAIRETGAPAGYDKLKAADDSEIIYYVVVTGGLNVTTSGITSPITAKYEITKTVEETEVKTKDVQILWTGVDGGTVSVEMFNMGKVLLTAKKLINYGGTPVNQKDNWSVNLNIYTSETGGTPVAYGRLTKANNEHYFTTNNSASSTNYYYFTRDTDYYVEEIFNSYGYCFNLSQLKIDGTYVTINPSGGRYKFNVGDRGFTIEATNDWLWGEVTFQKVDAENHTVPLPGATFEVRTWQKDDAHPDGAWLKLNNSTVEPVKNSEGKDTGMYKATIPLTSAAETEYRIYEIGAPEYYFADPTQYVKAMLSLANNVKDYSLSDDVANHECIANSKGFPILLTKYNNVHSATTNYDHVGVSDAQFKFYHQKEDGTWEEVAVYATDENGQVSYLAVPGHRYAVAEYKYNVAKFMGRDGIYKGTSVTDTNKTLLPEVPAEDLNGLVVTDEDGNEIPLYDLGTLSSSVMLFAYNIPIVARYIVKTDVGGYPTNVRAQMDFNIYEVPSDFVATDATVNAFLSTAPAPTPIFAQDQTTTDNHASNARATEYKWLNQADSSKGWDPTKTYLVVETQVKSKSGGTYNTMNKSDPDVNWFKLITPETDLNPSTRYETVLENIYSNAEVRLKKQIVDGQNDDGTDNLVASKTVDSLLEEGQNVVYVLSPEVNSKNQALAGFELSDKGLVFDPADDAPDYRITSVVIGKASHDPSKFGYTNETAPISATIEFYDGYDLSGDKLAVNEAGDTSITVDVSVSDQTVTAPDGTKSFHISYYSEKVSKYFEDTTAQGDGRVKIYYKDQNYLQYVLGEEFHVSPTKVFVTVDQQKDGDSTHAVKEVTKFTNNSQVRLGTSKWNANGTGVQLGYSTVPASAVINVNSVLLPVVEVSKSSAPENNIKIGGVNESTITYTIEVKNTGNPEEDFIDPLVLDMLPTGVTYIDRSATVLPGDSGLVEFGCEVIPKTGEATLVVHKADGTYDVGDQETALIFKLTGTLKPGKTVKIKFTALVKESVMMYGNIVENDVFLSSTHRSYYTESNPHGYSFCLQNDPADPADKFPGILEEEAAILDSAEPVSTHATRKYGGLDGELDNVGGLNLISDDFVWVVDKKQVTVTTQSNLTLVKAVMGDQDRAHGYDDTDAWLGTATRTNSTPGKETHGWVDYRLTVENGGVFTDDPASPDRYERHNIVIGDVVPKNNVTEATHWDVIMDSITSVMVGGETKSAGADGYFVYYYTGDGDPFAALDVAYADNVNWTGDTATAWPIPTVGPKPGWQLAADYETYVADQIASITDAAAKEARYDQLMDAVKAFVVVFDSSVKLKGGQTIVITLHTKVKDIPLDQDFTDVAFTIATNRFYINYQGLIEVLPSNPVSVTLLDKPIAVEGDLWIDEDWDSIQEDGLDNGGFYPDGTNGNRRDYSKYAIVSEILNGSYFTYIDNRNAASHTESEASYTPAEAAAKVGYGESIMHFRFDGLGGANPNGNPLYVDNKLSTSGLMTKDPFNYTVRFHLGSRGIGMLNAGILRRSTAGDNAYISDNADEKTDGSGNLLEYILDDNFHDTDTKAQGVYETDPFFLRYTVETDRTKDLGFQLVRNLEIEKVAQDDPTVKLEGAEFEVYGPFEQGEGTAASGAALTFKEDKDASGKVISYTYDPDGTVTTLKTNSEGKILIKGLNWWKEYVVKETKAATGYELTGTTTVATKTDGIGEDGEPYEEIKDLGNGTFTLKIPATNRTSADATMKVQVENPRRVKIQLDVEKIVKTFSEEEYTFDFRYWVANITPAATAALNADLGASDADPIDTMSLTLSGNKTSGTGNTTGSFDELTLCGAGVYKFIIKEDAPDPLPTGWTYDPHAERTVTVTVTWDDAAKKLVADIDYSEWSADDAEYETFTNEYVAEGSWTPVAYKTVEGRPIVPGEFTFTVKEGDTTVSTGSVNDDGTITFTAIDYDLSDLGTHTYVITEDPGSIPGMTYSTASITATVKLEVVDGEIKATEETYDPADQTFVNTWHAEGEWEPPVYKQLNGRDFNEGETFEVTVAKGSEIIRTGVATAGQNGVPIAFDIDPITYTQDELDFTADPDYGTVTFTYTITEKVPDPNPKDGVLFDDTEYEVNVTVKAQKNDDGTFKTELSVEDDLDDEDITFINDYSASAVPTQPKVKKTMTGEKTGKALTFEFELKVKSLEPEGAAFLTKDYDLDPETAKPIGVGNSWTRSITIPKGTTGPATFPVDDFDGFTFTKVGTYTFEITEKDDHANVPQVDFDANVWTYTVVVTDGLNGKLVATETYTAKDKDGNPVDVPEGTAAVEFENSYNPTPTEKPLHVKKKLTGEPLYDAENKVFWFDLTFLNGNTEGYEFTDPTSVSIKGSDVENNTPDAEKWFGAIKFTKEGKYSFQIKERVPNPNPDHNIWFDTVNWRVNIEIIDQNGALDVWHVEYIPSKVDEHHVTNGDLATFTNDYNPDDVPYQPAVSKLLTQSYGPTVEPKTFNFTLTPDAGNPAGCTFEKHTVTDGTEMEWNETKITIAPGETSEQTETFGTITYTKAGTYKYTITEWRPDLNPEEIPVHYDETEWLLTVVVKNGDGYLYIESDDITYAGAGESNHVSAKFKNSYRPEPVEWHPSAKKLMDKTGEPTVEPKSFTFTIAVPENSENPENGATLPSNPTVTVTVPKGSWESQVVPFGDIHFDKEGTYQFKITENAGSLPGVTYADGKVTLTVVIRNIKDKLTVYSVVASSIEGDMGAVVDDSNNEFTATVTATNKYVPTPTDWQAQVRKLMKAGEPTMSEKTFTFTLEATKFVAKGAFQGNNEITSSNKTWTRTITVPKGATLYDVVSDPKTFDLITFKKAGPYEFTISEKSGSEAGITYTGDVVTVKIEVIDRDGYLVKKISTSVEEKGAIEEKTIVKVFKIVKENEDSDPVEVEVKPGDENADLVTVSVDFNNRYDVKPVPYTPPVTKNIKVDFGDTVAEKIFRFDLKLISAKNDVDVNGQTVPRVLYDASDPDNIIDILDNDFVRTDSATVIVEKGGTVKSTSFSEIIFRKAGTYVFEITEYEPGEDETDPPLEEGITYSKKVWTMTVKVKDTNTGTPSVLALDGKPQFTEYDDSSKLVDADQKERIPEPIATNRIEAILESLKEEAVLEVEKEAVEDEKVKADADATEESEELEGPVFENEYKPEPVKWIPMIQKLLSEDSDVLHVDRTFDFEFVRVTAVSVGTNDPGDAKEAADNKEAVSEAVEEIPAAKKAPADAKATSDGCDLNTGKILYAQETLKKEDKTKKSDPVYFYPDKDANGVPTGEPVTITFDKAGTYYFEAKEILPDKNDPEAIKKLYPGFTYDDSTKKIEVKVTDIDGDLIIEKVTVDGVVVYEVEITQEIDQNTGRITYKVKAVDTEEKPEGYSDDTMIDEVTGKKIVITTVKITNEYLLRPLVITKNLLEHEDVDEDLQNGTERVEDPSTFVFRIEATWSYPGYNGSVVVYSNVVSMVFTQADQQSITINDLPVGTTVTVEEIYTGGNYDVKSDPLVEVDIVRYNPVTEPEKAAKVNFDNKHNGDWKDGGSVTNVIGSDGKRKEVHYAVDGPFTLEGGGAAEAEPEPETQEAK